MNRRRASLALSVTLSVALVGVLAGCGGGDAELPAPRPTASSAGDPGADATPAATATLASPDPPPAVDDRALDAALSTPREDSVYPDVGDPGVDALHYGLDLAWTPSRRTLAGVATIVLRSTTTADHLQLDLGQALKVGSVTLDGSAVPFTHPGKNLVVEAAVTKDQRYTLVVSYSGSPLPAAAPTTRTDLSTVGWTVTANGETWTMQEPYGAYTWYPVNDQPSDKAFYDITVTVPTPWRGVANGVLASHAVRDGLDTSRWHLDSPASSYLVTLAIGNYERSSTHAPGSGTMITYWIPRATPFFIGRLHKAGTALAWLERYLGSFPFHSIGFLLVDSDSGMETQTMITLGNNPYATAMPVLVHELAHQWYGDQVTPDDWSDVWMNEGMAMYLQLMWQAQHDHVTLDHELAPYARTEQKIRDRYGPPGAYDPADFASGNVYYSPALMWQALRHRIGDQKFLALIRDWPASHPQSSQDRTTFERWIEQQTGLDLTSFFHAWLLSTSSPAASALAS